MTPIFVSTCWEMSIQKKSDQNKLKFSILLRLKLRTLTKDSIRTFRNKLSLKLFKTSIKFVQIQDLKLLQTQSLLVQTFLNPLCTQTFHPKVTPNILKTLQLLHIKLKDLLIARWFRMLGKSIQKQFQKGKRNQYKYKIKITIFTNLTKDFTWIHTKNQYSKLHNSNKSI